MAFSFKDLSHYGDILAIPFFLMAFIYFYKIEDKDETEYALQAFSFAGFVLDVAFTYQHFFT